MMGVGCRPAVCAEGGEETIQIPGIERLCVDLSVDPTDPIMLLIAWRMRAETMCIFTREEWTRGLTDMGVDSIEGLVRAPRHVAGACAAAAGRRELDRRVLHWHATRAGSSCMAASHAACYGGRCFAPPTISLPPRAVCRQRESFDELRQLLEDADAFRDYYTWCFGFSKEPGYGVRTLPIDVAVQMWQLTLGERLNHLKDWIAFLEVKQIKAITKDVWDMLLTFGTDVDAEMTNYDDEGGAQPLRSCLLPARLSPFLSGE